jgi:hypothetical protein
MAGDPATAGAILSSLFPNCGIRDAATMHPIRRRIRDACRIEPFASMKLSSPHDGQPMARGVSDQRKAIISIHRPLELANVIWRVNGHTRNQEVPDLEFEDIPRCND